MNTNLLKTFAQQARIKLLSQVGAKLSYVLDTDTAELREKSNAVNELKQELSRNTKEQLIEKVAYTWFNRLMALRFMDANDYQPLGIRVITPKDGYTIPELLDEAKRGNISDELKVNREKIYELLDGKIPSKNPQNEAFKELLIASCNYLHTTFPFLFERINDYTELLLPDDLISDFSIVRDIIEGMPIQDCKNVEIIGWLYQFYISEENERLIKGKMVYKKHELAPASQLFTPKWIVQYMVDNTLGQLISELFPNTKVINQLEFYIKSAYIDQLPAREKKRIEEIKFFDPCVGSGHILTYTFDVFYMIYKEQGYNESEIPELIIKHNLFGTDIDDRAAQLASFALMMKGRQYYRRFLRKSIIPNIESYQDYEFDNKFKNAKALGSLIKVEPHEISNLQVDDSSIFGQQQAELKKLYSLLGQRYDVVVTNPPYISSSRMEGTLKQFVEANYPDTKSDLFATFVIRCLELCLENGLTGYMTPFVWMFISSYEKLRDAIINKHFINNLIQLEYSGFDGATVPICTFTLRKSHVIGGRGSYIRLSDFRGSKNQAPKTLEAIRNPKCGWFYTANQKNFGKIPNNTIGYWASSGLINSFSKTSLENYAVFKEGLTTANNDMFLRLWNEVSNKDISFNLVNSNSDTRWIPYNKGGSFRKWYGNRFFIVDWRINGSKIRNYKGSSFRNSKYQLKEGGTFSALSSSSLSARYSESGFAFDSKGTMFFSEKDLLKIIAYLNSKVCSKMLLLVCPTLDFRFGTIQKLPFPNEFDGDIDEIIDISRNDWNSREGSWDFKQNPLIIMQEQEVEEGIDLYKQYWEKKFCILHKSEEKLNIQFIGICDLQDELTPNVELEDITILQSELDRKALSKLNKKLKRDPETQLVTNYDEIELPFIASEVLEQFISYSVGCMFGRYSLDKEGLILANQGETIHDYDDKVVAKRIVIEHSDDPDKKMAKIPKITFEPDIDNIIPILDDYWFADGIVGRFHEFLKVTFGEENFSKNLAFIEEQIGKDIRKYFLRDFYADHIKRYKKRPIYWMFSSSKGSFNALIYMHRYTPDTVSNIWSKYLKEYMGKLGTRKEYLERLQVSGSAAEKNKALKEIERIKNIQDELEEYERVILLPLAKERISIDLDDGVLVNYNKFGKAVKEVNGLNDKKTKEKVRGFDWIDVTQIR